MWCSNLTTPTLKFDSKSGHQLGELDAIRENKIMRRRCSKPNTIVQSLSIAFKSAGKLCFHHNFCTRLQNAIPFHHLFSSSPFRPPPRLTSPLSLPALFSIPGVMCRGQTAWAGGEWEWREEKGSGRREAFVSQGLG